jgi:mRNA-degrading endonuclease toxin of MazEF toxin-antitoxin module
LRPVLIIKKFNNFSALIAPLTSNIKTGKYYYLVKIDDSHSSIILSQLRFINVKRLKYKIGQIENEDFIKVKRKIKKKIF